MKRHLKRKAAPRTWAIARKAHTHISRPQSSGHRLDAGLPLGVLLRDVLHLASSWSEVQKMLRLSTILVDGKARKNPLVHVGLFDVLTLPEPLSSFTAVFDRKGRVALQELPHSLIELKLSKVVGKSMIKEGKIQVHFHDGKNFLLGGKDLHFSLGDTLLLKIPERTLQQVVRLEPGVPVYLTQGKHRGDVGVLKEIKGKQAIYTHAQQQQNIETRKEYLFALPQEHPLVKKK